MILALISVSLNALAQIAIKSLSSLEPDSIFSYFRAWQLYATGFLYLSSIVLWFLALRTLPLSIAYPLQASGYVLVTLLAGLVFQEKITIFHIVSLSLIVLGVSVLAIGANK